MKLIVQITERGIEAHSENGFVAEFAREDEAHAIVNAYNSYAIAPYLEAGAEPKDYPYSELFDHMANEHGLTLTNTELGDIIHVARSEGTGAGWENAPDWAHYKTKDPDGSVFYWELEPQKKEDFWSQNANGGRFIVIGMDNWEELHQRHV